MSSFNIFKLKDNPFSAIPPGQERTVIWAGRATIKREVEGIIENAFISSPSRINIFWGEWGTGKTHTMKYFSQRGILDSISQKLNNKKGYPITIVCPKNMVLESLYVSILSGVDLEVLRKIIIKIARKNEAMTDQTTQINRIKKYVISDTYAKIFFALIQGDQKTREMAERYIFLDASGSDIKKIGVPRRIQTNIEKIDLLSQILRLLICNESDYNHLFLWIDEMEYIENLLGKDLTELRSFLRGLIDSVPNGLTITLLGTLKGTDELNSFLEYLGQAIRDRVFRPLEYPFLDIEDAKIYVTNLLNNLVYRDSQDIVELQKKEMVYYPFTETCITTIFRKLSENLKRSPTPRNINDTLSSVLEYYSREPAKMKELSTFTRLIAEEYINTNWKFLKMGVKLL